MKVAFAGSFAARIAEPVRARLSIPCDVIADDEAGIVARLADVDVLVSMGFSRRMAQAARRLRLVQVPGAGLDRIDRSALLPGTRLANAYGHEVGIAEYIIGAMIAMARSFSRLDAELRKGNWESQWAAGTPAPPLWPELAGSTLGILGYGRIGQALARRQLTNLPAERLEQTLVCAVLSDGSLDFDVRPLEMRQLAVEQCRADGPRQRDHGA